MATVRTVSPPTNYVVNLMQYCMGNHTHGRTFLIRSKTPQKIFPLSRQFDPEPTGEGAARYGWNR